MDDATYVSLYLRRKDLEKAEIRALIEEHDPQDNDESSDPVFFGFAERNHGDVGLETALEERSIPYDKNWDAGSNFHPGERSVRFAEDGTMNVYEHDEGEFCSAFEYLLGTAQSEGIDAAAKELQGYLNKYPEAPPLTEAAKP